MFNLFRFSFVFFFAQLSLAQTGFILSEPILVADGLGNHHPQIEITSDNLPAVSWTSAGSSSIYFAKMNDLGVFNPPQKLNPDGLDVWSFTWNGPDFAIEGENVYVVFKADNGASYMVKSSDNGISFGDTVRVASADAILPTFPDVAVYNDTVYVTFMNHMDFSGSSPNYVLARSVDGGASFEEFVLASDLFTDEVCDCCPPEIIVNADYVAIYFRNNDANIRDIKAVVSTDRGLTFSSFISIDEHDWFLLSCPSTGPDARLIDEENVVSVYKSTVDSEAKIFANKANLSTGLSIETVEVWSAASPGLSRNYPQIATEGERLAVVWEEVGDGTSIDVFFNVSGTGILDFNSDLALNLTHQAGVQSKPDIAIKSGIYHVVYANSTDGNLYYLNVTENSNVDEFSNLSNRMVYPSPFISTVFITVQEEVDLLIYDLLGHVVMNIKVDQPTIVETSDWPTGTYIVQLSGETGTTYHKIIKN